MHQTPYESPFLGFTRFLAAGLVAVLLLRQIDHEVARLWHRLRRTTSRWWEGLEQREEGNQMLTELSWLEHLLREDREKADV